MGGVQNDDGAEKRQHPREPMLLKVEYASTSEFLADYTENISSGGVFIATAADFDPGEQIDFSISFPGLLSPIAIRGEVKWRRGRDSAETPAGIGVEFLFDASPGCAALRNLIERVHQRRYRTDNDEPPVVFRVLLVEDNVVVRDMFRYGILKLSRRQGFVGTRLEVVEADNGKEAWDLLRSQTFHLVIVDLYMPVMDGGQLIEYIRGDEALRRLPVLVVSSGGREGRQRAIQTGADVYLDKPIKLKQMMETIETLIAIGHTPIDQPAPRD